MHRLRSHIIKFVAVTLLWLGFGLYVVQPAQASSSTRSFAQWFASMVQEGDTGELAKELNRLRNSGVELSRLIEHASQFISKHDKGFKLPLKGASGSHQIYQVLLLHWSQFQTGSGMANVPPPETVKSGTTLQIDKFNTPGHTSPTSFVTVVGSELSNTGVIRYLGYPSSLTPMANGIAIGAP